MKADPLDFGDAGLPWAAGVAPGPAVGTRTVGRVAVNGAEDYDSKGRVVRRYDPFYSTGWDFEVDAALSGRPHVEVEYDPLGRMTRTTDPDGTEHRVIQGIPSALADPAAFEPTPWVSFAYDPTDLDGLRSGNYAAPTTARAPSDHHGTPTSRLVDGLGRVIAQVERAGSDPTRDWYLTQSRYDLRGNLIEIVDTLGRTAVRRGYDLRERCLRNESLDAGLKTSVLDAAGSLVEFRDSKGAVVAANTTGCTAWCGSGRATTGRGSATLRERITYGDGGSPAQTASAREENRQRNRLGRVAAHRDEAGLLSLERYDLLGNVTERFRRTITDQVIAQGAPIDWSAPGASAALEATRFEVSARLQRTRSPGGDHLSARGPGPSRREPAGAARVRPRVRRLRSARSSGTRQAAVHRARLVQRARPARAVGARERGDDAAGVRPGQLQDGQGPVRAIDSRRGLGRLAGIGTAPPRQHLRLRPGRQRARDRRACTGLRHQGERGRAGPSDAEVRLRPAAQAAERHRQGLLGRRRAARAPRRPGVRRVSGPLRPRAARPEPGQRSRPHGVLHGALSPRSHGQRARDLLHGRRRVVDAPVRDRGAGPRGLEPGVLESADERRGGRGGDDLRLRRRRQRRAAEPGTVSVVRPRRPDDRAPLSSTALSRRWRRATCTARTARG